MNLRIQSSLQRCFAVCVCCFLGVGMQSQSFAQEIKYEDRIGSNKGFDICEEFRFKRITGLVKQGKLTQQQGFDIWKRIRSDEKAVQNVFRKAVEAGELTQDQVDRLLPLLDAEMVYFDNQHGRFGQPKELQEGEFQAGEVNPKNRAAVYEKLISANERGEIYDFDVASIMKQLYAGFDPDTAQIEEVAKYRGALNPRIAQSGSQERVLQMARMAREGRESPEGRSNRGGYGAGEVKIADPADWTKDLEVPVYSGPQPGERVLPPDAINLRGEDAGKEIRPIQLAGNKLHLIVLTQKSRTFGRFLGHLRKQLDAIESNSKNAWAMSLVVCADDANEAEKSFDVLERRYPKNLVVCLSKDGAAGPPAYGIDKNLTATVIVAKGGKVLHNLPYASDAFYAQPHILGAIADAMEVDHDTLRRLIGDTPGDAAGMAKRRRTRDDQ